MSSDIVGYRSRFVDVWQNNADYFKSLQLLAGLSRLFSENDVPYLDYRLVENMFCRFYDAVNDARSCIAYDARLGHLGIGIKTFILKNDASVEKIAEFNKLRPELVGLKGFDLAVKLGEFRNSRMEFADNAYAVSLSKYHFPISYKGEVHYVLCRAMQDANMNRLYVHEVFVAGKIKKGDTLQTAAFQPHGGISLYRDILANVLDASNNKEVWSASELQNKQSATDSTLRDDDKSDNQTPPNGNVPATSADKGNTDSSKKQEISEKIAEKESKVETNPTDAQKEAATTEEQKKAQVAPKSRRSAISQPTQSRIEDYGEVIAGARKDAMKELVKSVNDATSLVGAMVFCAYLIPNTSVSI
ncbi:MAG: hypothetical protein ACI35T_02980 [Alistipes sp.]